MPVLWAAFHSTRLVTITFTGVVGRKDIDEYMEGVMTPATLSYCKLIDLTQGSLFLSEDDVAALAERVREHSRAGSMGAVAIIVRRDEERHHAPLFEAVAAAADRPLKVFCDVEAGRHWLDPGSAPAAREAL